MLLKNFGSHFGGHLEFWSDCHSDPGNGFYTPENPIFDVLHMKIE